MQTLESKWISEHSDKVDNYSGKWIAVLKDKGIVASGDTLKEVKRELDRKEIKELPLITKVPREDEGMSILCEGAYDAGGWRKI